MPICRYEFGSAKALVQSPTTRRALATVALGLATAFAGWTCDGPSTSQQATPSSDLALTGAVVTHLVKPASTCTTANAPTGKILNAFIEQPPYEVAIGIAGYHGAGQYVLSPGGGAFVMVTDTTGGRHRQWANGSGTLNVERVSVGLSGSMKVTLSGVSTPTPDGIVEVQGSWDCQQVREVGS